MIHKCRCYAPLENKVNSTKLVVDHSNWRGQSQWTVLWNITKYISQHSHPPKLILWVWYGGRTGVLCGRSAISIIEMNVWKISAEQGDRFNSKSQSQTFIYTEWILRNFLLTYCIVCFEPNIYLLTPGPVVLVDMWQLQQDVCKTLGLTWTS